MEYRIRERREWTAEKGEGSVRGREEEPVISSEGGMAVELYGIVVVKEGG